MQAAKQADKQAGMQSYWQAGIQEGRQNRCTCRQADRHTGKQENRHTGLVVGVLYPGNINGYIRTGTYRQAVRQVVIVHNEVGTDSTLAPPSIISFGKPYLYSLK